MCKKVVRILFRVFIVLILISKSAIADVILDWNALMIEAIRADNSGPTLSSRNLAILHTAVYDAVNSIVRSHQPYRHLLDVASETSPEAAAVGAAYKTMEVLYQPFRPQADELFESWLSSTTMSASITNGLAFGRRMADLVLQDRSADGSTTDVPYIPSDAPGQWRRTPPFFRPPLTPQWGSVTPFCLPSLERFLPPPPPALNSKEYADAVNEVKAVGSLNSSSRTDEQTLIAKFWSDFSYTSMPPGHWHIIAETVARSRGNTLAENARLFALLSIAQADGAIVCWEAKFRYNFWRPVTAIQRADQDDNPLTEADTGWTQFLPSPPFPSYMSGHSTFSKASAQVLAQFYGTDSISFSATSDSVPGVTRTFHSFTKCADEIGMSRIYGGFHFMFDNVAGKESGRLIGDFVGANLLLPNDRLPLVRLESIDPGVPQLRVHGHVGSQCILERSSDLKLWVPVSTNTAVPGGIVLLDSSAHGPNHFYRVEERVD